MSRKKNYKVIINNKLFDSSKAELLYEKKDKFLSMSLGCCIAEHILIYKTNNCNYIKIIDEDYGSHISYEIISEEDYKRILKKYDLDLYLERFGPLEEL